MERDPEIVFNELKSRGLSYLKIKTEIIKLSAYKRIANVIAVLSHNLMVILFGFFGVLFLFITLGFYLGEVLRRYSLGFLIVFLLCLVMVLIAYLCKDWIKMKVTNCVIKSFREKEEDEDDDKESELKDIIKDERESIDPFTTTGSGPASTTGTF